MKRGSPVRVVFPPFTSVRARSRARAPPPPAGGGPPPRAPPPPPHEHAGLPGRRGLPPLHPRAGKIPGRRRLHGGGVVHGAADPGEAPPLPDAREEGVPVHGEGRGQRRGGGLRVGEVERIHDDAGEGAARGQGAAGAVEEGAAGGGVHLADEVLSPGDGGVVLVLYDLDPEEAARQERHEEEQEGEDEAGAEPGDGALVHRPPPFATLRERAAVRTAPRAGDFEGVFFFGVAFGFGAWSAAKRAASSFPSTTFQEIG